jgi:ligand-binding sensor domain-containing protein/signal transduction histidine kinase
MFAEHSNVGSQFESVGLKFLRQRRRKTGVRRILPCLIAAGLLALGHNGFGAAPPDNNYLLRRWTSAEGLAWGDIRSLARSPDGFLWIAADLGLVRFDGSSFEALGTAEFPIPPNDRATCLLVDHQGRLWAGTELGRLLVAESGRFREIPPPAPARTYKLSALAEDARGQLWAATEGAGLHCLHNGNWQTFTRSNGLPSELVSAVVCDVRGQVWAVANGKLVVWSGTKFTPTSLPTAEPVTAIATTRDEGVWVSTPASNRGLGQRLFRHKDGAWVEPATPYPWAQDSKSSTGESLLEDESGRLWITTSGSGVFHWSPDQKWSLLVHQGAPLSATVTVFIRDQEETFWFGVRGGQLYRARQRAVTLLVPDAQEHLLHTACASADGSVWLGSYGGGIYRLLNGTWTTYGRAEGLSNLYVFTLFEDRQKNLWAGLRSGLFRFRNGQFERVPGMSAGAFLTLFEDREGVIWIGSNNGLGRFKDGSISVFSQAAGVPPRDIRTIAQDADGRIWIAVRDGGLFREVDGRFQRTATHSPIDNADIRHLLFDSDGALWVATFGQGLFRLQGGRVSQWRIQNGLPSDYLLTLMEAPKGTFWISSANGIFGCSKVALAESAVAGNSSFAGRHLSVAEGLDSAAGSGWGQPVAARLQDGRLCFPNQNVAAVFAPEKLEQSEASWPVVINAVISDGAVQTAHGNEVIAIPSGVRQLEFHYTVADLLAAENLRFRYKLDGLEADWTEAGVRRTATYAHLPPGRYMFSVLAGSANGRWRETAHPVIVEIVPRWWERTTVRLAAAIAAIGALVFAVWTVGRARLRRRLQLLEVMHAAEAERQRIARDLHDNLGAGLTEIALMSDIAQTVVEQPHETKAKLNEIFAASRGLARALDETVWAISRKNETVEKSLVFIFKSAQDFLRLAGIACRIESPDVLPTTYFSSATRHNLFLATREALNNVVKHARATEVWLRLSVADDSLKLVIEDNGKGFTPSAATGGSAPSRSGLTNIGNRLRDAGGSAEWQSEPGRGTRVILTVKLKPGSPDAEE